MKKTELLAPAGSPEILCAAVDAGADAVYVGLEDFNARLNAGNFTTEQLREGCAYAHLRGSKVYLTLNTLLDDNELEIATGTAVSAYEAGADAVIVQDKGLLRLIRSRYPYIQIHASTQMNCFSEDDIRCLAAQGVKRIVLPRELSLNEIRLRSAVAAGVGVETEVFVHGAMCVSYSGLCLFSSMNKSGSRSGNRGLCAQPCRQAYKLYAGSTQIKEGHLLSPKDRSTVPVITELLSSGVASLKIEGRMRDKNYVVSAVNAYRRLIDAFYDGAVTDELKEDVMQDLLISFNRGGKFTSQYINGRKEDDFLSGEYAGKFGLRLGGISSFDPTRGIITVTVGENVPIPRKGEYLSIRLGSSELFSFPVGRVHEAPKSLSIKGLHPEAIEKLKKNEKYSVYLMSRECITASEKKKKTPIDFSVDFSETEGKISVSARVVSGINREAYYEYAEEMPHEFEGDAIPAERIIQQLSKTGDTPFRVNNVFFVNNTPIRCRISVINEIRRNVLSGLETEIRDIYEHRVAVPEYAVPEMPSTAGGERGTILRMHLFLSFPMIRGSMNRDADIYGFSVFDLLVHSFYEKIIGFIADEKVKLAVIMPDAYRDVLKGQLKPLFDKLKNDIGDSFCAVMDSETCISQNIYREYNVAHFVSAGANIYNSVSMRYASETADAVQLSYEVMPQNMEKLLNGSGTAGRKDFFVILHCGGPIPWMQTEFCLIGTHKVGCRSCLDNVKYTISEDGADGKTVISHPNGCSSAIYGKAKYEFDTDMCDTLANAGYGVIECTSEI